MSSNEHELIIQGLDFDTEIGIDFMYVYESAINHYRSMPEFNDIYEAYKMEVILNNASISAKEIEKHLEALRLNIDVLELMNVPELDILKDVELFDFLCRRRMSFMFKERLFNPPVKGVW